ncbi:hypothetical protein JAO78_014555 [Alishewanella sp. 16-MA]|uniref:Alpha-2-macroglobulin domain-containing protein n=1 Tax=Alishewanella maricola TaxID=2795740 RepID=A0ABS8C6Q9_9ALTE|nr:hypothetical protein [Alishewanella maricola]MCB5228032.1 hypothetical protein [Alishewanella maricola]
MTSTATYTKRAFSAIFITACLSVSLLSCTKWPSHTASVIDNTPSVEPSLALLDFKTLLLNETGLMQVQFRFNQALHTPGQLPLAKLTEAIEFQPELSCRWHFPEPSVLACDSQVATEQQVTVTLTERLMALNARLASPVTQHFSAGAFLLEVEGLSAFIRQSSFNHAHLLKVDPRWSEAQLAQLQLRLPSGKVRPTALTGGHYYPENQYRYQEISLETDETGEHQLFLPAGVSQPNAPERIIWQGEVFTQNRFLGWYCLAEPSQTAMTYTADQSEERQYRAIDPRHTDCPPQQLALRMLLAEPVAKDFFADHNEGIGPLAEHWVTGPYAEGNISREADGATLLHLYLSALASYQFQLTAIFPEATNLTFNTNAATPFWQMSKQDAQNALMLPWPEQAWQQHYAKKRTAFITQTDEALASSIAEKPKAVPEVLSQQSQSFDLTLYYQHFTSATAFQTWLNNLWQGIPPRKVERYGNEHSLFPALTAAELAAHFNTQQPWQSAVNDEHFAARSPLFSGETLAQSGVYVYQLADNTGKAVQNWLQRAAFNLQIFQAGDLVVQVTNWQQQPQAEVAISRLCLGQATPLLLGHTDPAGRLALPKHQLTQGLAAPEYAHCWIWSQQQNFIAITPLYLDEEEAVPQVWLASSQPVYQPGQSAEIMLLLRQQSAEGLAAPASLSDYQLTLKRHGQQLLSWPLTSALSESATTPFVTIAKINANPEAFYHYHLPAALIKHAGSYNVSLLKQDRVLKSHYFEVKPLRLPLYRLDTAHPEYVTPKQSAALTLSVSSMTGVPIQTELQHEASWRPLRYHYESSFPKEYRFDDEGDYPTPAKVISPYTTNENGQLSIPLQLPAGITVSHGAPAYQQHHIFDVTDSLGERQRSGSSMVIYNRTHLIGHQRTANLLKLVALELGTLHNTLDNTVPVTQALWRESADPTSAVLARCITKPARLPLDCEVPTQLKTDKRQWLYLHLHYGTPSQLAIKQVNLTEQKPNTKALSKPLIIAPETLNSWPATLDISIQSEIAREALLFVLSQGIEQVMPLRLTPGDNPVQLALTPAMQPELSLTLQYADEQQQLTRVTHDIRAAGSISALPFTLSLLTPATALQADNSVDIEITSKSTASVMLFWLDEALLYHTRSGALGNLNPNALVSRFKASYLYATDLASVFEPELITPFIMAQWPLSARMLSAGMQFAMADSAVRSSEPPALPQAEIPLWLGQHRLMANKPLRLTLNTPKKPGNWHLVAIAASTQQQHSQSISTLVKANLETRLHAPVEAFEGDDSYASVMLFNPNKQAEQQQLRLLLDDVSIAQWTVTLGAAERQQHAIALPKRHAGHYTLRLEQLSNSSDNPGVPRLLQQHKLQVLAAKAQQQRRLLTSNISRVSLPAGATVQSAQAFGAATQQADWAALMPQQTEAPTDWFEQLSDWLIAYTLSNKAPTWAGQVPLSNWAIAYRDDSGYRRYQAQQADNSSQLYTLWALQHLAALGVNTGDLLSASNIAEAEKQLASRYRPLSLDEQVLLALWQSMRQHVPLETLQGLRSQVGQASDAASLKLQAQLVVALGHLLNEDAALLPQYQQWQKALIQSGYQDQSFSQLDTVTACWVLYASPVNLPRLQGLKSRIVEAQHAAGHFGSAQANFICTLALYDAKSQAAAEPVAAKLRAVSNSDDWQHSLPANYWLSVQFEQPLTHIKALHQGLGLKRQLLKLQQGRWVTANEVLSGDILRVQLIVQSPVSRRDLTIHERLLPGLLLLPARDVETLPEEHATYTDSRSQIINTLWQQEQQLQLQVNAIEQGETILEYRVLATLPGRYQFGSSTIVLNNDWLVYGQSAGSDSLTILPQP